MKILLDPGHGGRDTGASFRDLYEKNVVLAICKIAQQRLCWDFWTNLSRRDDTFLSINERWVLANKWGADLLISVHCNADPDEDLPNMPEARGEEIWICLGSKRSRKLAESLTENVDYFFPGNKFRGIKETTHLGVLRWSMMPAALVEIGFIDNVETNKELGDEIVRNRIGRLLAAGIGNYAKGIERG